MCAAVFLTTNYRDMTRKIKRRRFILGFIIASLLVTDVILGAAHLATLKPYAITADDEIVCYVKSRDTASELMNEIISDLARDKTTVTAISSDIRVEEASGKHDTVSAEEAAEKVIE